jgi:hypothetical protein
MVVTANGLGCYSQSKTMQIAKFEINRIKNLLLPCD